MNDSNIVSVYTRQQAIEDGIFVDVTLTARSWGFRIPVAITTNLFNTHIKADTEDKTSTRLNAFLGVLRMKITESKQDDNMLCTKIAFYNSDEMVDVWAVVEGQSPDDPSPAMNVMLPEDY